MTTISRPLKYVCEVLLRGLINEMDILAVVRAMDVMVEGRLARDLLSTMEWNIFVLSLNPRLKEQAILTINHSVPYLVVCSRY